MDTNSLKIVLEALTNTTDKARDAFLIYLGYNLAVDLVIAGTVIFIVYYLASRIIRTYLTTVNTDKDCLWLYRECQLLVGDQPEVHSPRWISRSDCQSLLRKLQAKLDARP